jgi:hypothetical protein
MKTKHNKIKRHTKTIKRHTKTKKRHIRIQKLYNGGTTKPTITDFLNNDATNIITTCIDKRFCIKILKFCIYKKIIEPKTILGKIKYYTYDTLIGNKTEKVTFIRHLANHLKLANEKILNLYYHYFFVNTPTYNYLHNFIIEYYNQKHETQNETQNYGDLLLYDLVPPNNSKEHIIKEMMQNIKNHIFKQKNVREYDYFYDKYLIRKNKLQITKNEKEKKNKLYFVDSNQMIEHDNQSVKNYLTQLENILDTRHIKEEELKIIYDFLQKIFGFYNTYSSLKPKLYDSTSSTNIEINLENLNQKLKSTHFTESENFFVESLIRFLLDCEKHKDIEKNKLDISNIITPEIHYYLLSSNKEKKQKNIQQGGVLEVVIGVTSIVYISLFIFVIAMLFLGLENNFENLHKKILSNSF